MSLEDVKQLTKGDDGQIEAVYNLVSRRLIAKLNNRLDENVTKVPKDLEYIVIEVSIARFNYIGSEGMESENVEGHSVSFKEDMFAVYKEDIDDYIRKENPLDTYRKSGRVTFM